MAGNYRFLQQADIKDPETRSQIISLWKIYGVEAPHFALVRRLEKIVLALFHTPTQRVIGFTTATLRTIPIFKELYYEVGILVEPGHSGRPRLLEETISILHQTRSPLAKGVVALVKNNKISDRLLKRYGFTKLNDNFFFRDF